MINLLYSGSAKKWENYAKYIPTALKSRGIDVRFSRDFAPDQVDYIIYEPSSPLQDFAPFTKLKAVLNLWAGVEKIVGNRSLKVPLCRMVDGNLKEGMGEWVSGHVLRHHLGIDNHIINPNNDWVNIPPPLARHRSVGFLGLGELGQACAQMLQNLNFNVLGWSKSQKDLQGIACYSGKSGLKAMLAKSEILVLLLPQTPQTHHILNADTLADLPNGAVILNPGRGPLIDDNALIAALDSGKIGHATLDVFDIEPLPKDHAFWEHPKVTVTPHIASDTRTISAAEVIALNVERGETGQEFLFQVDRDFGY